MSNVTFQDGWKPLFLSNNLCTLEDYFRFTGGEVINRNGRRNVMTFELKGEGRQGRFFLKRFYRPHFKDTAAAFRNFGKVCSQACTEYFNTRKLQEIGIGTYEPVCYGSEMIGPIEKRSFLVTKQLQGECLADHLAGNWHQMLDERRKKLLDGMAKVLADAHHAGLSFPDAYVWHYWVFSPDGDYTLGKIDLHMTKHRAGIPDQVRDLGAVYFSMNKKYFSEDHKEYLLDSYFRFSGREKNILYPRIIKRTEKLNLRRRLDY